MPIALSACTSLPQPQVPTVAAPQQFKESGQLAEAGSTNPARPWWTLFGDVQLDALEQRVAVGNVALRQVAAQVRSAKAALEASLSAQRPSMSAGLSVNRSQTAQGSLLNAGPNNAFALNANASWELDLWGRLSGANAVASANVQASEADLMAARLSVQATLAQLYLSARASEVQQVLLANVVQANQEIVRLTQARHEAGVATLADVLQAQTQARNADNQLRDSVAQRAQTEHAIATLLGLAPLQFDLPHTAALPSAPRVPATLPSALLERRPDLVAARARVQAALAQVGVTDAAWFPTISLTTNASLNQSSMAALLNNPNSAWSFGTTLAHALLDAGVRRQASSQARANAEQVGANYQQLVLTALQEVEDNLALARQLSTEVAQQAASHEAALRNAGLVQAQWEAGTASALQWHAARIAAWNAESTLASLTLRQLLAINTLLKNLAGVWDETPAAAATNQSSLVTG